MPVTDPAASEAVAVDLCRFIASSPSPYHAVATAVARLDAAGFVELALDEPWPAHAAGGRYVRRGGTLVAWRASGPAVGRYRIVGAHTDSPNLRIKPRPDHSSAGVAQLGVEVYGGVLLNSWLDRDLGVSGRAVLRDASAPGGFREQLFRVDEPVLRIPQLAIHLDREVNDRGLVLNKQAHLVPMWGAAGPDVPAFGRFVAGVLDADPADVVGWDAMLHDTAAPAITGLAREYVSAPRIDNQLSCHAAITALAAVEPADHVAVVALFDHEEVGSTSDVGADGAFLAAVLERIGASAGLDRAAHLAALAGSHCVSSDCAHATHPNYPERHEPDHRVALNGGPVVKVNTSMRYATDAVSAAPLLAACEAAGAPVQWFVTRSDLACGSTIGPLTAAQLGIPTVDVGVAQLAMHSARELCGAHDPARYVAVLSAYFQGTAAPSGR
jgi:aspartyl aminopeptidase